MKQAVAGSLGSSVLIQMLNACTGVLLARALGPIGRGELAAVLLWPGLLVAAGSFGVDDAITYYVARGSDKLGAILGAAAIYWAVQSTAIVGTGFVVLPLALGHDGSHVVRLAWLYLLYAPFLLAIAYAMSVLQGLRRFGAFQALRIGQIALVAVSIAVLAFSSRLNLGVAVIIYLVAYATVATAALVILRRACPVLPQVDRDVTRRLGAYAIRSHSNNVSSLLNERLDQFVISVFLAPAALGVYVIAVTFTSLTNLIGQSVGMIALPSVVAERDVTERVAAVRRYLKLTISVAVVATVPLFVLAPQLISLFFGQAFLSAVSVTRVLLIAAAVLTSTRLLQSMLKALGKPLEAGISEAGALGVTLISLAVLLPWLGILGAGIASLVAYLASAVWTARRASSALGLGSAWFLVIAPSTPAPADAGGVA